MIKMLKGFAQFISLGVCLVSVTPLAQGQAYVQRSNWGFEFSPAVWGTRTEAVPNDTAGAQEPESFESRLEDLKPSATAESILRYGRAFLAMDGNAVEISELSAQSGGGNLTKMIESAPRAGIDVLRVGNGYFEPFTVSLSGGVRYLQLGPGFINQSAEGGTTKKEIEPLLGSNLTYRMSSHWALNVEGDVSRGLRTNIVPSWRVCGGLEVGVGSRTAFRLGYQELHLQLQTDTLPAEAIVTGPTLGFSIRLGRSAQMVR